MTHHTCILTSILPYNQKVKATKSSRLYTKVVLLAVLGMKLLLFLLFAIFFIMVSAEVNDESVAESPLNQISYLLAKMQRLEAKMTKPTIRNIRQADKLSDSYNETDDKMLDAVKECPPQIVTYIRWGNDTCPYGANTIYQGVAAGGDHGHSGSPANMMCLPPDPMRFPDNLYQSGSYYAYGVEYQVSGLLNQADDRNMPCAVCEVIGKSTKLMIPSHYVCPDGWRMEYNGFIMAGRHNHAGSSMYTCIDKAVEQISGSGGDHGGHQMYTIYAFSGHFLPYISGYAMTCVVCTK